MTEGPYSFVVLRRGAVHFLTGKVASGSLTFVSLLLLVRLMSIDEYSEYVTLIGGAQLAYAISGLGLAWAAALFIPDYRLHATGSQLANLAVRLLKWQAVSLIACAVFLLWALPAYLSWAAMDVAFQVVIVWLVFFLCEGMALFFREGLLGPLMQQALVRTSVVSRQLLFLVSLGGLTWWREVSLASVLVAELLASTVGMVIAARGLKQCLLANSANPGDPGWKEVDSRRLWGTALPMFVAHVSTLAYSPSLLLVLLQRFAGVEATATFGFLRSLYEQIARFLPASLLLSLIRPKLIASYVGGGGMIALSRQANWAGKWTLLILMPGVTLAAVGGEPLIGLFSAAKFSDTGHLFFLFMLALIPFSQRQLLETVAVATGHAGYCTKMSLTGLLLLPLAIGWLYLGGGIWASVVTLGIGHLAFAAGMTWILGSNGYVSDHKSLGKVLVSGLFSGMMAWMLPTLYPSWVYLSVLVVVVLIAYWVAIWVTGVLTKEDRELLARAMKVP